MREGHFQGGPGNARIAAPPAPLSNMLKDLAIFAATAFSDADAATPPERFLLVKWGRTEYTKDGKGGHIDFSEADADAIIAEFADRARDLVVDYDHQTLGDGKAPAAGWITALAKTPEGLEATVNWTPKGRDHLAQREYRYHSPVLAFGQGSHPRSLHSVALTNHPAFHGYQPLVADDLPDKAGKPHQKKHTMNEQLKKLSEALGLPQAFDDADEKADEKAAKAIQDKVEAERKATSDFLALHDCKTLDDVTGKLKGMVPAAEKAELEGKLAAIEAEKAVRKAFDDGKLVEAQREWATEYATRDLEAFNAFCEKQPKVAPGPAEAFSDKPAPKKERDFDDEELAILSKMGLSPDDFKKSDKKEDK